MDTVQVRGEERYTMREWFLFPNRLNLLLIDDWDEAIDERLIPRLVVWLKTIAKCHNETEECSLLMGERMRRLIEDALLSYQLSWRIMVMLILVDLLVRPNAQKFLHGKDVTFLALFQTALLDYYKGKRSWNSAAYAFTVPGFIDAQSELYRHMWQNEDSPPLSHHPQLQPSS